MREREEAPLIVKSLFSFGPLLICKGGCLAVALQRVFALVKFWIVDIGGEGRGKYNIYK